MSITINWGRASSQLQALGERARQKIEQEVDREVHKGALKIEADAVRLAPVDIGQLRTSIGVRNASTSSSIIYEVYCNVPYGRFVEYGTHAHKVPFTPIKAWATRKGIQNWFGVWKHIAEHGTKPQPFMRPAFFKNERKIEESIKSAVRRGIRSR